MIGIGIDAVDVGRFRAVLGRRPAIVGRLFTESEQRDARTRRDPSERFAARFAAKEAALKAMGVGLGRVKLTDIEVVTAPSGAPQLVLHGSAAALAADLGVSKWRLSLTHTAHLAAAVAVAE